MNKVSFMFAKIKSLLTCEVIYLTSDILVKAIAFISLPFFTNIMSPADFGEFSLYQAYSSFFGIFFGLNIYSGIVRYYIEKQDQSKYLTTAVWLTFGCSIGCSLVFIGIDTYFNISGLSTRALLAICICAMFQNLMYIGLENTRAMLKVFVYALCSVFLSVISTGLGLILVYTMQTELGYWRLISIAVSMVIVAGILTMGIIRSNGLCFKKETAHYLLVYSLPLIPFTLSTTILAQINTFFLANYDLSMVGIYTFSLNLTSIIYVVSISLNRAYQPFLFISLRDNKDYEKRLIQNICLFYIVYLGFLFGSDFLIWIFGNVQYIGAAHVIPILTLGYGFCFLYSHYTNFLYYFKKNHVLSALSVGGAIVSIIFSAILIPNYGYIGAAISMAGSYLFLFICIFIYVRHEFSQKIFTANKILLALFLLFLPVCVKLIIWGIV